MTNAAPRTLSGHTHEITAIALSRDVSLQIFVTHALDDECQC